MHPRAEAPPIDKLTMAASHVRVTSLEGREAAMRGSRIYGHIRDRTETRLVMRSPCSFPCLSVLLLQEVATAVSSNAHRTWVGGARKMQRAVLATTTSRFRFTDASSSVACSVCVTDACFLHPSCVSMNCPVFGVCRRRRTFASGAWHLAPTRAHRVFVFFLHLSSFGRPRWSACALVSKRWRKIVK